MAEEKDFNDILENIFLSENKQCEKSYEEGFEVGFEGGNPEGYHLGYHRGAQLGRELGHYLGIVSHHLENQEKSEAQYTEKIIKQLEKVKDLIDTFPRSNSEDHDILELAEAIRAQYKKACSLLKIPSTNPYAKTIMDNSSKLRHQLDRTIEFLMPLLSLANCHMVEFFTNNHWEKLLPSDLRQYLDNCDINDAVQQFWKCAKKECNGYDELTKWMVSCQSHYISINNAFCISTTDLQEKIKSWGGNVKHKVRIKEFMTSKKSYEVETMSHLVASLSSVTGATHCVEAGGGKGHLPVALTLAYNLPSLTVDCDLQTINNAQKRVKIIQKQWHAIAKKIQNGGEEFVSKSIDSNLHRFTVTFITKDTDLVEIVREKFPENSDDDVKLLLTGLHTCGNLGPASLRIFSSREAISGVLNVPCCYHLLDETLDDQLFDVFQRDQRDILDYGFPMAEHLRGFNLGRNARMLASQSIDRVAYNQKLPDKSLLYRALLQVIIKTHQPDLPVSEGKLKGIGSKCKDFDEYFKMADSRLKLGLYGSLPENYLKDLGNIDHKWKKIVLFYLTRLCLAQVIESVILMDRLLYLYENGFDNVYLVKLFDPVLSPRCHGIVAVR